MGYGLDEGFWWILAGRYHFRLPAYWLESFVASGLQKNSPGPEMQEVAGS
jgi:hypothetical protein